MRIYPATSLENVRARDLLQDWRAEGWVSPEQFERMLPGTACDLRRTNIFLRLVLFFFTVLIVAAIAGLFFVTVEPSPRGSGWILLLLSVTTYGAMEIAVSQARLYRFGIEEALAASSVTLLFLGVWGIFAGDSYYGPTSKVVGSLQCVAGTTLSLWIGHRLGLVYAPIAAMLITAAMPSIWTSAATWQHVAAAALFGAGLAAVLVMRPRHRFTHLDREYAVAEAALWLGIYVAINLQLSSIDLFGHWWGSHVWVREQFPAGFYWSTWVLIWCWPALVLAHGIRQKDRWVMGAGAIAAVLTLVTNKPYLGGETHPWDPMLLGALLTGVALLLRRWLAKWPEGVRHGFTAERLSAKDQAWIGVGATVMTVMSPELVQPHTAPRPSEPQFGGGSSGGGGASSDF